MAKKDRFLHTIQGVGKQALKVSIHADDQRMRHRRIEQRANTVATCSSRPTNVSTAPRTMECAKPRAQEYQCTD